MYIPSFIQLWKILLFSVLWSGFAKSPVCVLFCFFSFSPRQRKSNWLIQVCTIAPQIWEKLVLVLFSGPGDGRGGWKTKMAFLLPNGHPVKSLLDGPALSGEHTSSVKKIWKQNRTSLAWPVLCTSFWWEERVWHGSLPLGPLTGGSGICLPYFTMLPNLWKNIFQGLRQIFEGDGVRVWG